MNPSWRPQDFRAWPPQLPAQELESMTTIRKLLKACNFLGDRSLGSMLTLPRVQTPPR
jgi:hypothetical protein